MGGGGAGGAYVKSTLSVISNTVYTVTVGAGGITSASAAVAGSPSWFNTAGTIFAEGGAGGASVTATTATLLGAGGVGSTNSSIGTFKTKGGDGYTCLDATTQSAGGGGSGGTATNGTSATSNIGATAVAGGGAGGNGPSSAGNSATGTPGLGGGGGGAWAAASTTQRNGAAGGAGKVLITYTLGAATYTWVATSGSADWTSAASWSPSRTTPAINDILLFNQGGNSTAFNVPTETDGKLQVSGNTAITLQASGANTLTIGETASDSLTVASGSQLNVNGTSALLINVSTGAKGSISGAMTFSNATHTLTAADASGITFNSGATFTQNCLGNVFGSGTANSIIFASGSTFTQLTGGNPFKSTAPASVVVFQTGSLFSCQGNTAPSTSGRTYGNFEYNTIATNTVNGSSALTISNLTVLQGILNVSMSGGFNLLGNASVSTGATLNLNNTVTTSAGKTVTVNGNLLGTASISGSAAITITANGTLSPGPFGTSIGTLTFAAAPTLNGTNYLKIDRNGGSPLADKIVVSSGTLAYGGKLIVTNIGAPLQFGDTFTNFSAAAYSGAFTSTNLPPLTGSLFWDTSQLSISGVISVTMPDVPPVANADSYSVTENTTNNLLRPLANDVMNMPSGGLNLVRISPTNGTASISGTNVLFTPTVNFTGTAFVGYVITDGFGGNSTNVITVTVTNIPPQANPDSYTVVEYSTGNVFSPLANDTVNTVGGSLHLVSASSADGATALFNSNQQITFTPTIGFSGSTTINYQVTDGIGGTSSGTIAVNVTFAPPSLTVRTIPEKIVVQWVDTSFNLQSATNAAGPFDDVPDATSPFTNSIGTLPAQFFRLAPAPGGS